MFKKFHLMSFCLGSLLVTSQPQAQAQTNVQNYVVARLGTYCNKYSQNQGQYNQCTNYTSRHFVACINNGGWGHNQSTGVDLNLVDYCLQSARAKHTRHVGGRTPVVCDRRGCLRRPGGGIIGPLD